jgi:hypothetical protein
VLVDGMAAGVQAVRQGVSWLRRAAARVLRSAAAALDPLPVGVPVPVVEAEEEWPDERWTIAPEAPAEAVPEAPAVLVMPAAAQVTEAPAPANALAAVLERCGSVRAAARELGVAESTLRGRMRNAGVKAPGRKLRR